VEPTVFVTPEVEAGTNRGGEDLRVLYEAVVDGDQVPTSLDDFRVELSTDEDGWSFTGEHVKNHDSGVCAGPTSEGVYHVRTDHYEFEWRTTTETVLDEQAPDYNADFEGYRPPTKAVREFLLEPDRWCFCHKLGEPPRLKSVYSLFVGGNAD